MPADADPALDPRASVVLACGLTTLDVVQTVDHVPGADEKLVATDLLVSAGGPAANAAVTARLLGVPARLVTRIGASALGTVVAGDLAARGVDVVDRAAQDDTPPVSSVLVTRSTGQRAVVSVNATRTGRRDVGAAPSTDTVAVPSEDLWDGVAVLLVDGHHLDLALECATEARRRGVVVVLDGGSWKPGLAGLLRLVDVAVLSADFEVPDEALPDEVLPDDVRRAAQSAPPATTGDPTLARVRALGPAVVAQSHGGDPLRVLAGADVEEVRVPQVTAVDTLGAGDVLHGALVAWLAAVGVDPGAGGRALSEHVREALAWAVEVASASVAAPGAHGWAARPDRPSLQQATSRERRP